MSLRILVLSAALLCGCTPPAPTAKDAPPVTATPAAAGDIRVDNVTFYQRLTSPVHITGVAPNSWYFEAVFQAKLLAADGTVIVEGPAQAQTDWMTEGPVPFVVDFTFSVPADTKATLVLAEDMYGSEDHPGATRILKIPVTLVASR